MLREDRHGTVLGLHEEHRAALVLHEGEPVHSAEDNLAGVRHVLRLVLPQARGLSIQVRRRVDAQEEEPRGVVLVPLVVVPVDGPLALEPFSQAECPVPHPRVVRCGEGRLASEDEACQSDLHNGVRVPVAIAATPIPNPHGDR
eukprot:CAMPEP_0176320158 /NCGR_PEP_ID=MMETSP0121_2-20121125/70679_1 /TAXON_ID=160619 /ORGANISM="Kryptoperidinium foliaceum, Strain CCMP 1326" /LENGTH=143 /DNA_ID=CAMNT_0017662541 /DNA_START=36 /DNA_END=465 /DNA_ORIENTATION=+